MLYEDDELIKEICLKNYEFKSLFEEHIRLEQDLEALYSLKYFPPEVENNIKEIKRRKLLGKDMMEKIIAGYKSGAV